MILVSKVFKEGNSLVVSLPEEVVAQLGLREGDEVSVSIDDAGGRLIVKPKHSGVLEIDQTLADQLDEFIEKYGPALEALSK